MRNLLFLLLYLTLITVSGSAQSNTTPVTLPVLTEIPDTMPDQARQVIVFNNPYHYEVHQSHQSGDRVYWQHAEVQTKDVFDRYTYYWDSRNSAVVILHSSSSSTALRFKVFSDHPAAGGMSFDD